MHVLGIIISVIIVSGMLVSLGLVIYKNILKIKKQKLEIKEKENKKCGVINNVNKFNCNS